MGLLSCPLSCQPNEDSNSHSLSASSISSEPSLPAVPSLTPPSKPFSSSHHIITTLHLHSSAIFSLALANDHVISGSSDGEICIWPHHSSHSYPVYHKLSGSGRSAVKSIVFSDDRLFTAHQDHKIRAWKFKDEKFKFLAVLPTIQDRVARIFSANNYVKVRRHVRHTWVHHVDTVSALALSRDKSLLYSASWDRSFKIWKVSNFKCIESIWNAHDDAVNTLVLSSDGLVYTGSGDRKIKVWERENDRKKHRLVATLEKHKSTINALALSIDGSVLYSGACDRSIIVWENSSTNNDGEYMVAVGALRGHKKAILCLKVAGDLVFSGSADQTVRIWRRANDKGNRVQTGNGRKYSCLGVLEDHKGPVKCLEVVVDSETAVVDSSYKLYSGSLDCDIKLWHVSFPLLL